MNWTNKYSLPLPITSAIRNYNALYDRVGDISVTGLIKPPRMRQLELRHDAEIEVDYSDFLWVLLGQAMHRILEKADTTDHLVEERLTLELFGWTVSAKPDLFTPYETLEDYKCTSVFSFLLGEKDEWTQQLNLYDVFYRAHGFNAKALRVNAILRDHMKSRAKRERDYPQCGFYVKDVEKWPEGTQSAFLAYRVGLHQGAVELADDDLPMCTDKERWARPSTWAVKKKGGKRAVRVFESEAEVSDYKGPKHQVEFRPGSSPRCESFCSVKSFCSYGRTL